jgi:membrane protein required for colicin V production
MGILVMNIALLVDLGVVLVLLMSAGVSFFRGFIREVLTIFGMIGGLMAALTLGGMVRPFVQGWFGITEGKDPGKLFDLIPMSIAADVTAFGGIFLGVFIVLQLVSYFLSGAAHAVGLGPVDRTLGVFFGIARGVLLLGIIYLPFHLILSEEKKEEWLSPAKTYVYLNGISGWLAGFMPESAAGSQEEDVKNKIKALDFLGTKEKESQDKPDDGSLPSSSPDRGYNPQERGSLNGLIIQESSPSPAPSQTPSRSPNE